MNEEEQTNPLSSARPGSEDTKLLLKKQTAPEIQHTPIATVELANHKSNPIGTPFKSNQSKSVAFSSPDPFDNSPDNRRVLFHKSFNGNESNGTKTDMWGTNCFPPSPTKSMRTNIDEFENTIDPSSILPTLEQTTLHWKAANQSVTPFDHVQLVQTLNHAQKPGCTIQVRLITENIKSDRNDYHSVFNVNRDEVMRCVECGGDLVFQNQANQAKHQMHSSVHFNSFCDVVGCQKDITKTEENAFFQCENGTDHKNGQNKDFCVNCVTEHYGRHRTTQITKNQHKYSDYTFEMEKQKDFSILKTLKSAGVDVQAQNKVVSFGIAKEFEPEEKPHGQVYAHVSFWEKTRDGPVCNHEFIVDKPRQVMRNGFQNYLELQEFLFVSDDRKHLFCFSGDFDEDKDLNLHLIDLCAEKPEPTVAPIVHGEIKKYLKSYLTIPLSHEDSMLPKARLLAGDIICFGTWKQKGVQIKDLPKPNYIVPSLHFFNWKTSEILYHIQDAKTLVQTVEQATDLTQDFYVIKQVEIKISGAQVQLQKHQSKSMGLEKLFAKGQLPSLVRDGSLRSLPPMIQKHTWKESKDSHMVQQGASIAVYYLAKVDCKTGTFIEGEQAELLGSYKDVELEAYLHNLGEDRITINAKQENCMTFSLSKDKLTAREMFKHTNATKDAEVVIDQDGCIQLFGRMKQERRDSGGWVNQNDYSMIIIDLNQPQKLLQQVQRSKVYFQITDEFKNGNTPMRIMPFAKTDSVDEYQSQMFFVDMTTSKISCYMIIGRTEEICTEIKPPSLVSTQPEHVIEHPILCYTSSDPQKRSLMVCNLAKNMPQRKLHLGLRFLCFIDSRSQVHRSQIICEIDFLGLNERGEVKLYRISVNPYDDGGLQHEEYHMVQINSMDLDFRPYSHHDIVKASLLTFNVPMSYDTKNALVVQMPNNILMFQKDSVQALFGEEQKNDEAKMAPLFIVQRSDRVYYVMRSKREGDEIMCLKYDELTYETINRSEFKQKEKILQLQFDYDTLPTQQDQSTPGSGKILILDTSYKLRILVYQNQKKYTSDVILVESQQINLSELPVKRLFRALEIIPWQTCVLTTKAIIAVRLQVVDLTQSKSAIPTIQREYTIYSLDSKTYYTRKFLNFDRAKSSFKGEHKRNVFTEIRHFRGIGRVMALGSEGRFCYFLQTQCPVLRRIDLMKFWQLQKLKAQIVVVGRAIVISFLQKFLIFNQDTMLLEGIHQGRNLEVVDDPNSAEPLLDITDVNSKSKNLYTLQDYQPVRLYDRSQISNSTYGLTLNLMHCLNFDPQKHGTIHDRLTIGREINDQKEDKRSKQGGKFNYKICGQCVFDKSPVLTRELKFQGKEEYQTQFNHKYDESEIYIIKTQPYGDHGEQNNLQVYYVHFSKTKLPDDFSTLMTNSYYVLSCNKRVWFIKKDKIKTFVVGEEKSFNFQDYKVDQHIKHIDMLKLFQGEISCAQGLNVKHVPQRDMYMLMNSSALKNSEGDYKYNEAIQISLKEEAIVWDLDNDQEIKTLMKIDDFSEINNYTRTGFSIYRNLPIEDSTLNKQNEHQIKPSSTLQMKPQYCKYFQTNNDCSIISAPKTDTQMPAVFRTYTFQEIVVMNQIENQIKHFGESTVTEDHISQSLMTSNFNGYTFYMQFYQYANILELVDQMITDFSFRSDDQDRQGEILTRRIYYTILAPFEESSRDNQSKDRIVAIKELKKKLKRQPSKLSSVGQQNEVGEERQKIKYRSTQDCPKFENKHNLVQWLIKKDRPEFEQMIAIMLRAGKDVSLRALIQNFPHFKSVFNIQCEAIDDFMAHANIETPMTKKVTNLVWDPSIKKVVFSADTAMYSNKMIKQFAKDEMRSKSQQVNWLKRQFSSIMSNQLRETSRIVVQIRIIEVSWLNQNIPAFYEYLAGQNRPSLFDNELIKVLLQQQHYTNQILIFTFLPYMVYMILLLLYFVHFVPNPKHYPQVFFDFEQEPIQSVTRVVITCLSVFLGGIEVQQMVIMKWDYWYDFWNYGNISVILVNMFIILEHSTEFTGLKPHLLVYLTTLATCQLWVMFYYWWRLYPETAFYVKMLMEIIIDLKYFILFYFMIICTFTSTQLILDQHFQTLMFDGSSHTYERLAKKQTSNYVFDAWINQWILGMGEFDLEPFAANGSDLQWVFFVIATFLSNIVFFNMLVAIMADTFAKITEKKERNGMIQQTKLYADFIRNLRVSKEMNNSRFLYIITPLSEVVKEQGGGDQWEGGYNRITDRLHEIEVKNQLNKKQEQRQSRLEFKYIKDALQTIQEKQRRIIQLSSKKDKQSGQTFYRQNKDSQSIYNDRGATSGLVNINVEQEDRGSRKGSAANEELLYLKKQRTSSYVGQRLADRDSHLDLINQTDNSQRIEQMILKFTKEMGSKFDETQQEIRRISDKMVALEHSRSLKHSGNQLQMPPAKSVSFKTPSSPVVRKHV